MPTKGEYRYTTDEEGRIKAQRYGVNRLTGTGGWHDVGDDIPDNKAMSGNTITDRNQNVATQTKRKAKQRARELWQRGAASKQRAQEAQEMGIGQRMMLHAGRETDKLLAGGGDILDFLQDLVTPGGSQSAMDRTNARRKEQTEKDRLFREVQEETPISGFVGASLPYVVSGTLANPISKKLGQGLVGAVEKGVETAGTASKSLLTKAVDKAADQPGVIGKIGQQAQQEWSGPLRRRALRRSRRSVRSDPYRKGLASEITGNTLLGAAEGGLHYDMDMGSGAAASGIGSATGYAVKPYVTRSPDYWDPGERDLINWAKDQGVRPSPGADTGSARLLKFENLLERSADTTDVMGQFNRENMDIANKVAMNSIGLDTGGLTPTPKMLSDHLSGLKSEYEDLVSKSSSTFTPQDFTSLMEIRNQLRNSPAKGSARLAKEVEGYVKQLMKASTRERHADRPGFDFVLGGRDFQGIRSDIKEQVSKAWNKGDQTRAKSLQSIIDAMDQGMERSIRTNRGDASVAQWKDLNERYALTSLLIENGMTPMGEFDPKKMLNYMMQHDPRRTILEQGGRIADIQKMAKYIDMVNRARQRSASGLVSGHALNQTAELSPLQMVMSSPAAGYMPILPYVYMNLYKRGYPAKTGLLGMTGTGAGNPVRYTRAGQMGQPPFEYISDRFADWWNKPEEETE